METLSCLKHCDNNEALKALCNQAGWIVEEADITYRKGFKPPDPQPTESTEQTARISPASTSYNPSPTSSYQPSPARTSSGGGSLIPWLKNLGNSVSAPVTPPLSSPTSRGSPRAKVDRDLSPMAKEENLWSKFNDNHHLFSSMPPSPRDRGCAVGSESPTFSLLTPAAQIWHTFGGGSTPGQSGTCSPVMAGHAPLRSSEDFAFSNISVKPWQGERIHEECGNDDELKLTLGPSLSSCEVKP
eukprot:TRINITY_DN23011_c0_g1_i3.p1 TRINITY_DN23011_c0_g1~~TRINITY_DN23011_c0_g1_i3.p1  ORF type:complete len:243 (+),score=-11.31 TRINITY_DN23011_c0_g1_i3:716-1444(+)